MQITWVGFQPRTFTLLEHVLPLNHQASPVARGSFNPMCWQQVPQQFNRCCFCILKFPADGWNHNWAIIWRSLPLFLLFGLLKKMFQLCQFTKVTFLETWIPFCIFCTDETLSVCFLYTLYWWNFISMFCIFCTDASGVNSGSCICQQTTDVHQIFASTHYFSWLSYFIQMSWLSYLQPAVRLFPFWFRLLLRIQFTIC